MFGKNASAGVINVITQKPGKAAGRAVEIQAGENNLFGFRGTVTAPFSDRLGGRLTTFYRARDGYVHNYFNNRDINNEKTYGLRAKLEYDDGVNTIIGIGDYSISDRNCCTVQPRRLADDPARAALFRTFILPVVPSETNTDVNINTPPFSTSEQWGYSLEARRALSEAHTLTSITAYRAWNFESDIDAEGLPFTNARRGLTIVPNAFGANDQTQFTQEFRLNSDLGRANTVLGLFYFDQEISRDFRRAVLLCGQQTPVGDPCAVPINITQAYLAKINTRNLAAFGDATIRLSPSFEVFGGLRYAHENLDYDYVRTTTTNGTPTKFSGVGGTSDYFITGRAGVRYIFNDDVSAYASYNRGSKGKGFDITTASTPALLARQPVDPETSDAYELGLRSRLFDRRLTVNITAFDTKFKDFQAQSYNSEIVTFALQNVGRVETRGVEIELAANPTSNLHISAGGGYIDAEIKEYPNGSCYAGQPRVTTTTGSVASPLKCGTNGTTTTADDQQNLAGGRLPDSPKWKANIAIAYTLPLPTLPFDGFVQANYNWQDDTQFSLANNPLTVQEAYGVVDASVGVQSRDGGYTLKIYTRNLFNQAYAASIFEQPGLGGNGGLAHLIPREASRFVGASLALISEASWRLGSERLTVSEPSL